MEAQENGSDGNGIQHNRHRGGCRHVLGRDQHTRSRVRISTVGVILMIVGAVGLAISAAIFGSSRRTTTGRRSRTYDREVIDAQGRTAAVHEEVH
jgi:hypothetical protein